MSFYYYLVLLSIYCLLARRLSFHSTHLLPLAVQAGVLLFAMVLPEDTVALSPVQALSFLTLRTKLISWLDKNSPEGSDGANGKPPVSKRREQVRRAQK